MKNLSKNIPLKYKLLSMVALVITLLTAGSMVSMNFLGKDYVQEIEHTMHILGRGLGEKIAAQFYERYGDAQAFALNETLQSLEARQMQTDLNDYVTLYGIYDVIVVVDKNGRFVAANDKDVGGKEVNKAALAEFNYRDQPWFKAVISGQTTDDKERAFAGTFFEDPHVDPVTAAALGEKRASSSFSAAIKNSKGEIIGVVSNRASSKWIDTEI